jgi:hypothetical protein
MAMLASACVTNPGPFTIRVTPGAEVFLKDDVGGNITREFTYDDPACSDGSDNDLDGLTDFGSDSQCDAANDTNERVDGVQSFTAPSLPIEIDEAGEITTDPTDLVFPQTEVCIDLGSSGGVSCMGLTVRGTGGPQTGNVNSETEELTLNLPLTIDLDALVGFPGLGANCAIGPINGSYVANDYNTTTGATTFFVLDVPVPAASNCGTNYNTLINGWGGLPGAADIIITCTILNPNGDPIATA